MCQRFIIPPAVLSRLAEDGDIAEDSRAALSATAACELSWRTLRDAHTRATQASLLTSRAAALGAAATGLAKVPETPVFDCRQTTSLPGVAVADPATSKDATAQRAFEETAAVAQFYRNCFGRNSVDNAGMTLVSSIHYGVKYSNAFWNGSQMAYGDGDGQIFLDFTKSNDVIGHELTHGVTQFTAGLDYENEAGALNESVSDVFGSMFRQWQGQQSADKADWLIGKDILGPRALDKGYTCLRDMADPPPRIASHRSPRTTAPTCRAVIRMRAAASPITRSTWPPPSTAPTPGRPWERSGTRLSPARRQRKT